MEPQLGISLSTVLPCLNESETLTTCLEDVFRALERVDAVGKAVVSDNGSTDGSQEIARRLGPRGVEVAEKGYGAALQGGIAAACGEFIVMGDADGSYNFGDVPKFVAKL